jgi:hypothetical protein
MKVKKLLGFCVAFAAASLMTSAVYAAKYSVESTSSKAGEEVTLSVKVAPNDGETSTSVNGFALQITYDSDVLTPVAETVASTDDDSAYATTRYATNELAKGIMVSDVIDNTDGDDIVAVGWADTDAVTVEDETTVATITFAVKSDTTETSTDLDVVVKADAKSDTELAETSEVAEGTVTLGEDFLYGDVTADGFVKAVDVVYAAEYSVGLTNLTEDQIKRANVDGQDGVKAGDVVEIAEYSVGLLDKFQVEK